VKIYHRFFAWAFLCGAVALGACDLKPHITSIPDNIGEFISTRYPALLADPDKEPEIYNSAVTDYGVYASPELYGSDKDYLVYANVDDYKFTPAEENKVETKSEQSQVQADDYLVVPKYTAPSGTTSESVTGDTVIVARGDTLYSIAKKHDTTVAELAKLNSLDEPYTLSVGQKINVRSGMSVPSKIEPAKKQVVVVQTQTTESVKTVTPSVAPHTTRVAVQEITVAPGDTLYSLSRKYQIPVNDLAVMNKISSPFTLSVGQKLRVPKTDVVVAQTTTNKTTSDKNKTTSAKMATAVKESGKEKISSDPKKQLPKISARSNAKFSWPVRGKILSQYGAKNGGLFNDGINIAANIGTAVGAAENGVVAYAGNEVKGMGNLIIMQHSDGWMTVYAHLDSMSVRRGAKVSVGQQIGKIGKTGKVDSPQLHFEIRKGTKAYNPIQYLKK